MTDNKKDIKLIARFKHSTYVQLKKDDITIFYVGSIDGMKKNIVGNTTYYHFFRHESGIDVYVCSYVDIDTHFDFVFFDNKTQVIPNFKECE